MALSSTRGPEVSVVLPVRDGAETLEAAAASILGQTWTDLELIVVDDGSTDRTPEVAKSLEGSDPRVRVVTRAAEGLVPALEAGLSVARGSFLARMDADDRSPPDRIACQLEAMAADRDLVLCGTPVRYEPREGLTDGLLRYERWLNGAADRTDLGRDVFVECPLAHPTFLARRGAVEAVGGYRDRGWPEDYDLLLRLWRTGGRIACVRTSPHLWLDGPTRLSRTDPRYALAAFRRCKVHHLTRSVLRDRDEVVVWGAGPTGKAFARLLRERGYRLRAFVDLDPRKIGQTIHGAPVRHPGEIERERGTFCLLAVAQEGARDEIRAELDERDWIEGEDYLPVA